MRVVLTYLSQALDKLLVTRASVSAPFLCVFMRACESTALE